MFLRSHLRGVGAAVNLRMDGGWVVQSAGKSCGTGCAKAGEFLNIGYADFDLRHIRLKLHQVAVGRRAAVNPQFRQENTCILRHSVHKVGNLVRNALNARFNDLGFACRAGDARQQTRGLAVPIGCAKTCERWYKVGFIGRVGSTGQHLALASDANSATSFFSHVMTAPV